MQANLRVVSSVLDPSEEPRLIAPAIETGTRACIVMDDSSGGDHANLERDRRLWGGVALLPRIAQTIQTALRGLEISNDIYTGYPTIHFTDLANGEGRYWDLKGKARIAPIELFGDLFTRFNLPVLIVQVAPSTVEQLIANGHEFVQLPGIDTTRPDDLALMMCYRVLHGGSFDAVGYHGELSIVADRWNGRENSVQPLYKDEVGVPFGTPVIDGLFPVWNRLHVGGELSAFTASGLRCVGLFAVGADACVWRR